ncbi:MAG: chemotaxis protein CheW [Gloeomargarita sp. SRBZ-1_bins_9]
MKVLYFPVGSLQVGWPLTQVQKVIPYPTVYSSGQRPIGLAHFEQQEVIVLDLHQYLFGQPNASPPTHLTVVRSGGELYGVPCSGIPALMEVAPPEIQPLPPTYRQADTLGLASHVIRRSEEPLTVFLLDSQRLAALCHPAPALS